jgi:DNA sulfur modification protein DndD
VRTHAGKLDYLEKENAGLAERHSERLEEMSTAMGTAWCALIGEPMRKALAALRDRELELHTAITRSGLLEQLAAGNETDCPACLQHVDEEARKRVQEALTARGGAAGAADQVELATVRARIVAVEKLLASANREALQLHWSALDQIDRDMFTNDAEIREIKEELDSDEEENVRRTRGDLETVIREIIATENGINRIRKSVQENAGWRDNTQRKLSKYAGSSLDLEQQRQALAARLEELFADGVALYRDQLRRRVEADASEHFRKLTSEPDYAGLRINDSYGLTIVHKDGSDIPVRSAGAEHVVAFSLVGALQNNAPLRGPVVIDSPFGRLDGVHRENTVNVLPSIASQVVVLVYEDELPPAEARESFKGRLKAEWKLKRVTARHTDLVPAE